MAKSCKLGSFRTGKLTTLSTVRTPGAGISTKAAFVIEDRVPGVNETYLRPYAQAKMPAESERELIQQTIDNETQP